MKKTFAVAVLATALAGPAGAQGEHATRDMGPAMQGGAMGAPVSCPAPAPVPAAYAGWAAPVALTAATTVQELAMATLRPGRAARASLTPADRVAFPLAPAHAPAPGSFGGLFAFAVTTAGSYRVALGAPAWIDVVRDGRGIASTAHGHGPDCTGIRKVVDFTLAPGRYLLQLSGAARPEVTVMVTPAAP